MYRTTETAQLADLLLPATGWGEKEGAFMVVVGDEKRAPKNGLLPPKTYPSTASGGSLRDRETESRDNRFQLVEALSQRELRHGIYCLFYNHYKVKSSAHDVNCSVSNICYLFRQHHLHCCALKSKLPPVGLQTSNKKWNMIYRCT